MKKNKKVKNPIKEKAVVLPKAETETDKVKKTKIRVVGIGGGGGNIVSEIASRVKGASFAAANTDIQALKALGKKLITFQFGESLTRGLGTGMNPETGEQAAESAKEKIEKLLQGQDLVILVATFGGGTGSGALPVFARISRSLGNLTLGIFTTPFKFEGDKKAEIANSALEKIRPRLNAFTVVPNENIFQLVEKTTPLVKAFSSINKVLAKSLEGLIEMIYEPGLINIDFADLKTILSGQGRLAYLNTVEINKSESVAKETIDRVLNSPLYSYNIKGAKGVLLNIAGEKELELAEVSQISKTISDLANKEAKIIFGISQGKKYQNLVKTTLLATGCTIRANVPKRRPTKRAKKVQKIIKEIKNKIAPKPKIKKPAKKRNRSQSKHIFKIKKKTEKTEPVAVKVEVRKNALQLREEVNAQEAEILAQEKAWEVPSFLKKKE